MTAPDIIYAWPWEVNPNCGQWETTPSIVGETVRYIRADAPELLALVEAVQTIVSSAWGYDHLFDSAFHAEVHDTLYDKLMAYEAMK